ncbi:MAG: LAGLIDADG family homing endonuclease [bacterium]|nr:LAGLIDADG family homing endonuclease [bacterium]
MQLDLSKLSYSHNDIKREIKIPEYLDEDLAFLMGLHLGDGNIFSKSHDINYTGNLYEEYNWYITWILPLLKKKFNIMFKIHHDTRPKRESIRIRTRSKVIFTFYTQVLMLPPGKKDSCGIPYMIMRAPKNIQKAFLRGYIDTDFCLTFTRRKKGGLNKYPKIILNTNNQQLCKDTVLLLQEMGYIPYFRYNFYRPRYDQPLFSNEININGKEQLEKWMREIGFSSPKHFTKYYI